MKVITKAFETAAADGEITLKEVEDIRDAALVALPKEKVGQIDQYERAEFAAAAKKYGAILNDAGEDFDAFPTYTSLDLVRQLSKPQTCNLSLKKASFSYEASDAGAGQQHLTLNGQAKNGKLFEIQLHRSNPGIDPSSKWTGSIVIQENKDGAAPEAQRPLSPSEMAQLGGQRGLSKWFESAPSEGMIEAAREALKKYDAGFLSGPDLRGECEDGDEDCAAEPTGPQVEYRPFDWSSKPKGAIVEALGGIPSDFSYAYSLMLVPAQQGDPDGMVDVEGFYVYVVRSDMGVTEIAELGDFMKGE